MIFSMPSKEQYLLGIDPGRAKTGLALVHLHEGKLFPMFLQVVRLEQFEAKIAEIKEKWDFQRIILGDGTGSQELKRRLGQSKASQVPVTVIDEHNSSFEARRRYWQEHPPRGLWRLVPCGLRVPPEAFDQYVALILIERFLALGK